MIKRRVEDLDVAILKQLSMHLNPRMMCGGDWRNLAGHFGMRYMQIVNIDEREKNPTLAILKDWWTEGGDRSVSALVRLMKEMKRADCVRLLEPFEYYGMVILFAVVCIKERQLDQTGAGTGLNRNNLSLLFLGPRDIRVAVLCKITGCFDFEIRNVLLYYSCLCRLSLKDKLGMFFSYRTTNRFTV